MARSGGGNRSREIDCVKLVIDMNLSPEWEQVFSQHYEIKHWSRIGAADAPDEEILRWARENGYFILTNDLDFGAILAACHWESPSVFQIRSTILDPTIIAAEVFACVKKFEPDLLAGALISYELQNARVRRLPIT